MNKNQNISIFQRPAWVVIFALTAAFLWGWAFPLVKLGFNEFEITPEMTGGKMLFAGIRFFFAGLLILLVAKQSGRPFKMRRCSDWWFIVALALVGTTLHYAFFYFGMSHAMGSRAAILNSLSVFLVVIFACMFFKSDRMSVKKAVGCVVGFAGIMALNIGGKESGSFTLLGDGMIIVNTICSAVAALMTRGLNKRINVIVGTGYGLSIGGGLLIVAGIIAGGILPRISAYGIMILLMLTAISSIGFALYNKLLSCNPIGKVGIYNSIIPIVGAITSCICLNEPFQWNYLLAGFLAATGIYIINKSKG